MLIMGLIILIIRLITLLLPLILITNEITNGNTINFNNNTKISKIIDNNRVERSKLTIFCGYKIYYESNFSEESRIKVMTEGILIKEIQRDFLLREYSVIVLDEVHERTVNLDILVGLLNRIIRVRMKEENPLKLILMSATVEPEQFNKVFFKNFVNFEIFKIKSKIFKYIYFMS